MAKADFTRDYYGDLEIAPGADVSEIKKQFKKLALAYHPDRNPGRESEVTAKFQKIQSAHEVLIDSIERSKYDANRIRGGSRYGGGSSGVRGNPWSGTASQYPPPPKPPTARQRPPPPSTGARRYEKFATPGSSSYQSSQEGPQARKDTYEAWEKVRHQKPTPGDGNTGPGKSWKAPQPPPRGTPQSGREESNAKRHAPPHRPVPGFEEFRESNLNGRRSQSSNTPNRKGFMPNTPGGGDEPPAPMGAYFTERNKPTVPPEVPPRAPPRESFPRESFTREAYEEFDNKRPTSSNPIPNPLKQFQDKPMGNEPRISTPYATHGGEKFNPFESTNINRSKSTRESQSRFNDDHLPRTGSDSNLNSPQRARSFAQKSSPRTQRQTFKESVNLDPSSEDSSDGFVQMNTRSRVPRSNGAANGTQQGPSTPLNPDTNGQPQSSRPQTQPEPQPTYPNGESIFSFNINDETFNRTTRQQSNGFSNSAENISTKFTPEDWDGKFEAGADYFKPELNGRTQSTSRPRGRSPVKVRPIDTTKFGQTRVESETPVESPGGTKFSAEEWKETFKPQTFMPTTVNPPPRQATTPGRKRTGPSIRPTMGTAAVVDDGESSDSKPLFTGRKNMHSMTSSPEPMDVDTPPAHNTVPQYATTPNGHLKVNTEQSKRAASTSVSQSPTDTEGLKVNFDDLKIKDLMSTLALPIPPNAPLLPYTEAEFQRPSRVAYDDYITRYEKYMAEWDVYNSKYLLHMVARRRQNDSLKDRRWTDPQATELYRLGLKEDQAVLKSWGEMQEVHEGVVKAFVVLRERMMSREGIAEGAGIKARPRKKTH
ncbi:hypothetical protein VTL71DRAFT_8941 [Oculimacula yallundae]|uniref:J domain-containing protein n=1 Tax=Oculimacula yallundae TaxID=86028 RepID=A0ABR4BV06_9HELO